MRQALRFIAQYSVAMVVTALAAAPTAAQFLEKPTRPQVETPKGLVRQVIFKNCTACHGIDDYTYNALDRSGWSSLIDAKHAGQNVSISDQDRGGLVDWLVKEFGVGAKR